MEIVVKLLELSLFLGFIFIVVSRRPVEFTFCLGTSSTIGYQANANF